MDKQPLINSSQDAEVRKGPWTMEEDLILINYIANHGEGLWNSLARAAGLKRTGKSCRLRWLNYLRPDVRRGNITTEEELLIMELHAKWGNRWSKIAKHLPGRTDNEIKNYWRTKIQKHIKQAEACTGQNSVQTSDQASASQQACGTADTAAEIYSPPSYNLPDDYPLHLHYPHQQHHHHQEAFQGTTLSTMSTENYWSMEDIWSMQLFNGD